MDVEKLVVSLTMDTSKYVENLQNAQNKTNSGVEGIASKLSSIGSSIAKVGAIGTASVTAPLVALGIASINTASDVNESMSKVQVVFGESSKQILDWATKASTSLGMSSQMALEAAGTYGNLFTSMGMGQKDASGLSKNLVQLAADLGSFNNLDPSEVLDKLRAGLTGESEPLKTLGINMNAASVEAKALELGFTKVNGTFTDAQLIQARYALIMEKTKNAQGDFARTSDGLANSQRILNAQFADAKAKIGNQLLPIALKLTSFVSGLLDKFNSLNPSVQKGIVIFAGIAAAIFPLLTVIGGLITSLSSIIPILSGITIAGAPIFAIILAIIGVIALLKLAWDNNFLGMRDTITAFWNTTLKPIVDKIILWFQTNIPVAINYLKGVWQSLQPAFQTIGNILQTYVFPILQAISELVGAVLSVAFKVLGWIIQNLIIPYFQLMWKIFSTYILPVIIDVAKWLDEKLTPAFKWLGDMVEKVTTFIKKMANALGNIHIPDFLKPGSPPPLYYSLRYIGSQMQSLSRTIIPDFNAQLNANAEMSLMSVPSGNATSNQGVIEAINSMSASNKPASAQQIARALREELQLAGMGA